MLRATFKSLMSRKARLLLSGIAVILGVTFVSGALVLNASLGDSVRSMFTTVFDDVDVQVTGEALDNSAGRTAPISHTDVDTIADVPGVAEAEGVVQDGTGLVQVVGKNGKVPPMTGPPTIGQNWTPPEGTLELRDGRGPQADDEIVINAQLAGATGYRVGDTIPLILGDPEPVDYTLVGIVGYSGGRDSIAGESLIEFTLDEARARLMTEPDSFTAVMVTADDGTDVDRLRDDVSAALGSGFEVKTGEDLADEQTEMFADVLNVFNYLLLGFGAVALLVSVFLIINTFSIIVAQRTKELALFRALGAGRGQITGSVLLEAAVIGVLSGVVGLILGVGVGYLGTIALASTAADSMSPSLVVPVSAVVAALVVGVGVTMLAAILPARSAAKVAPIAAMRDAAAVNRPIRWFAVFGGLFLVGGGALLWAALSGGFGDSGNGRLLAILGAVGSLFVGAAIFTPVVARPIVSVIGSLLSWSLPGTLGRRNSARNPRRTAITASALMIGIALVSAVGVLLTSMEESITKYFDTSVSADILIAGQQAGPQPPVFDPSVLERTRALPDVDEAAAIYFSAGTVDGSDISLVGVDDAAAYADMLGEQIDDGTLDGFGGDDVAVDRSVADDRDLSVGDTVEVTIGTADGPTTLTVAAITTGGDGWLVSDARAEDFTFPSPTQGFVKLHDDADTGAITERINGFLDTNPLMSAGDISGLTDQITMIFDVILVVIQVLLALAIFIAVIGVVNTLTLSVLERTRELGLLRAVGMTRGQVTRMVTVESVVISLFGAVLGVAIGAGLGIAVQQGLKDEFLDVLAMPWGTMVFYVVAAVVIGLLAALIPAYRANRLDVLDAISYE